MLGDDPRVIAAITAGIRNLNTAVAEQERAVNRILGLVEVLMERAPDQDTFLKLEAILETLGFQDTTGQRIAKVNRLLRHLAREMGATNAQIDKAGAAETKADKAAAGGLSQEEVDKLLKGR